MVVRLEFGLCNKYMRMRRLCSSRIIESVSLKHVLGISVVVLMFEWFGYRFGYCFVYTNSFMYWNQEVWIPVANDVS